MSSLVKDSHWERVFLFPGSILPLVHRPFGGKEKSARQVFLGGVPARRVFRVPAPAVAGCSGRLPGALLEGGVEIQFSVTENGTGSFETWKGVNWLHFMKAA